MNPFQTWSESKVNPSLQPGGGLRFPERAELYNRAQLVAEVHDTTISVIHSWITLRSTNWCSPTCIMLGMSAS